MVLLMCEVINHLYVLLLLNLRVLFSDMIRCQTHSFFTHLSHRRHPLHDDCEECTRHIEHAHQTKDQPENSSCKFSVSELKVRLFWGAKS